MTPNCIQVNEGIFNSIVRGCRTSIVKRGRKNYPLGPLQVMDSDEDLPRIIEIDVKSIRHIRARDVPRSESFLVEEIIDSFPGVKGEEEITEVNFTVSIESLASYVSPGG